MTNKIIEIHQLEKTFTTHHLDKTMTAVEGISFSLEKGGFVGVVGKSGSGKSTIIKCIYRTYLPQNGQIFYDSESFGKIDLASASEREIIQLRKNEIGYVSQFLSVMPRTTTLELVEQSLLETGVDQATATKRAKEALQHFDIAEELWDSYPVTFSGGEKLRLNIARATVKNPRLLLLDEPTASLDNESKQKVREVIQKLKNEGTTMIGIFHDLEFMDGLCDYTYHMQDRRMEMN
ncbi:phosphonates transport ATP-binding protein PhnL [Carnobacterium sp. 17-4]|uniref:phosphonate C-P lyase system protein PhnL n=1 Tax=Carnobacterium sp. (strain 17-4) TaxID=208596 RepID=UPI000205921F|nr:phosphonate C-P lyase system protein PhnL [Carnobacterium sp. 17-4]AEB29215.1 phosphonates transport ATP-binding protein PhnL [Carnobacterium sp. 17-4]